MLGVEVLENSDPDPGPVIGGVQGMLTFMFTLMIIAATYYHLLAKERKSIKVGNCTGD